jgi:hypothetical protein
MTKDIEATELPDWERSDKKVLRLFGVTVGTFSVLVIIGSLYLGIGLLEIIGAPFIILTFSFFITGFLAFKHHYRRGIIRTKKVLKWFAIISLFSAIGATIPLLYLISAEVQDGGQLLAATIVIFLAMMLAIFLILLLFMLAGFGIFGVVSVFQRRYTARYLVKVRNLTSSTSDSLDRKNRIEDSALKWLFKVPKVLDSSTLAIDPSEPRKEFPWRTFRSALMWEIFFSAVLAIYVSLNPFLFEVGSFEERFSLASSLSITIPIFVIPWFIYRRLKARIKGPAADFWLFDGIVSRMVGTLVAFGTLLIFLRFALRDIPAFEILIQFVNFYFFFTIVIVIATFVYFNYFEDDLSISILNDFNRLKSQSASLTSDKLEQE